MKQVSVQALPMNFYATRPRRQRGVVLIVCLVLLAVVTILGLSTMSGSGLELKMSAGFRDRSVAFEAAEETLRVAEQWLDDTTLNDDNYYASCAGNDCFSATCDDGLCAFYDAGDPFDIGVTREDCGAKIEPPDNPVWRWAGAAGEPNLWLDNNKSVRVTPTHPQVSEDSRYIIEFMCYVNRVPANQCTAANPANCVPQFRITALARGLTNNSIVMLQSMFKKVN